MDDTTTLAGSHRILLEHEYVAAAWRLQLDESVLAVHLDRPEHALLKARRAHGVANSEGDVRQAVAPHTGRRHQFHEKVTTDPAGSV